MNKPSETPSSPADLAELDRLRGHNAELLAELKTAKAKVTALQAQVTSATEERDAARAEVRAVRLDAPVRDLVGRVALPGTADLLLRMLGERGITFDLDGDQVVIRDAAGNPATVIDPRTSQTAPASKPRPAKFDERDLTLLMTEEGLPEGERHALSATFPRFIVGTKASGGGAQGGSGPSAPKPPAAPAPKPSAPKAFGLT